MSRRISGPTAFAQAALAYLRHFRALGLRYRYTEHTLTLLGRHLVTAGAVDLDAAEFERWRHSRAARHANTRRKSEQIVRRFCLYRQRHDAGVFVPDAAGFTRSRPHIRPVIVEPEHIARMLALADRLPPGNRSPLRAPVARVATVLLYTSGLRSGEVLRLRVEDLVEQGAVLQIRESKFHKSRLVPLSPSAQAEVRRYLMARAAVARRSGHRGPLLCLQRGSGLGPYSPTGLRQMIHRLLEAANIRDPEGRRPRVHDLRHSFAVQALMASYREHGDPQALLPKLALYLGHVSIASTLHYLRLVPTLAALASARLDAHFGSLILGDQP
jgi:integrase